MKRFSKRINCRPTSPTPRRRGKNSAIFTDTPMRLRSILSPIHRRKRSTHNANSVSAARFRSCGIPMRARWNSLPYGTKRMDAPWSISLSSRWGRSLSSSGHPKKSRFIWLNAAGVCPPFRGKGSGWMPGRTERSAPGSQAKHRFVK